MRCLAFSTAALLVFSAGALAEDKEKAGLKPGDPLGAFTVLDCTGPAEGTKLCYR